MKNDGIHQDFFPVPDLPYKKKEQEAILLLQTIINVHISSNASSDWWSIENLLDDNKKLVDWIMKYKGK